MIVGGRGQWKGLAAVMDAASPRLSASPQNAVPALPPASLT